MTVQNLIDYLKTIDSPDLPVLRADNDGGLENVVRVYIDINQQTKTTVLVIK